VSRENGAAWRYDFRTVETEFRKQGQGLAQREVWCAERVSEQVHVWSSDV
jgi:hypothetical protein